MEKLNLYLQTQSLTEVIAKKVELKTEELNLKIISNDKINF